MVAESTIERYRDAAIALLPPGRAIAKSLGSNVAKLLKASMVEFARIHEDADVLLRNAIPADAVEYLEDWEEALGLPGDCVAVPPTTDAERQGAVVAKLRGRTSHAKAVYEAAAAAMGYTQLEFVHFTPFAAGASVAGDAVYSDEWMHVVRIYVPVGDQTADDALVCTFVDQLRRSHTFTDIILEGPMGAERTNAPQYYNDTTTSTLAAPGVLTGIVGVSVRYGGFVSIQCTIDDGAGGNPSDNPVGSWELYASGDGVNYTLVSAAASEMAKIAPNGNNKVDAFAILTDVPGTSIKVRYNRTSGGAGNSRVKMRITTW